MTKAHIASVLPIKNRVLAADENTAFLAHYDLNEHDVLRGVKSLGGKTSLDFEGKAKVDVDFSPPLSDKWSINFWVMWYGNKARNYFIDTRKGTNQGFGFKINDDKSTLQVFHTGSGGSDPVSTTYTLPISTWVHIAATYNNGTFNIYANGVLQTNSVKSHSPANMGKVTLGNYYSGTGYGLNGKMMHLKMYNKELNIQEINKDMIGEVNESGLVGYWKMDEGEGEVVRDSSPLHNDGHTVYEPSWSTASSIFTLRSQDGKFGGAIAVEEGTTNLAPQNISGLSGLDYSYVGLENGYSKYAISGTWNNGSYPYSIAIASPYYTGGLSYTTSCYIYTNVPQKFNANFGTLTVVNDGALAGAREMVRDGNYSMIRDYIHSRDFPNNPTYVRSGAIADGTVFDPVTDFLYIKDIQIEQKSFATSFVDGSRALGNLEYPNPLSGMSQFTIAFWMKTIGNKAAYSSIMSIANQEANNSNTFNIDLQTMASMRCFAYDATGSSVILTAAFAPNEWAHVSVVRSLTHFSIYVNGLLADSLPSTENFQMGSIISIGKRIGSEGMDGRHGNLLLDELRIDKVARAEEEVLAWYESNSPFWPRGIYRKSY